MARGADRRPHAAQDRLHAILSASPVLRADPPPGPGEVIAEAARAIHAAMPKVAGADDGASLPSRLQRMADALRREGRAGMARDLDIASGIAASMLLERSSTSGAGSPSVDAGALT